MSYERFTFSSLLVENARRRIPNLTKTKTSTCNFGGCITFPYAQYIILLRTEVLTVNSASTSNLKPLKFLRSLENDTHTFCR